MPKNNRNGNRNRQVVVVQTRKSSGVGKRKRSNKASKAAQVMYNPNSLRFDAGSNGLIQKVNQMVAGPAGGALGTGMFGTTGNPYLDNLVDPFRGPIRIPDDYTRPTSVHQSFAYFTVTTDANGEAVIVLNPIFGDGASAPTRLRWISWAAPATPASTYVDDPDRDLFVGATPIVSGLRPVSSAMLVSYIGNTLSDGGQISAGWLPGDMNATTLADILDTNGLQSLALQPGAYTGPLAKGAYVYWKPDDIQDIQFQTPTASLSHAYPLLVVCIKSTQASTVTVRVSGVTNFEFTTDRRVTEQLCGMVEPQLITHARKILAQYPSSCANDEHVSLWQRIQQGCRDFFSMIGDSFRNLFAPSLRDIGAAAPAITPLVQSFMPQNAAAQALGVAAKALAAPSA